MYLPSLAAGSIVCISSGTYSSIFNIYNVHGASGKPIIFQPDPANTTAPVFTGTILVRSSSYVTVMNLDISRPYVVGPTTSAVVIDGGSSYVTILGNHIHDSMFGVTVGGGTTGTAGPAVVVQNNIILNNVHNGISFGLGGGGVAGNPNIAWNNEVGYSGGYGIDIDTTSNVTVDSNYVHDSGQSKLITGYSGIHIFQATDTVGGCTNNLIVHNKVWGTLDPQTYDGNGIQIDHFCDGNTAAFNVVWGNAGAGIAIFTAANNQVFNNTLYGNNKRANILAGLASSVSWAAYNAVGEVQISDCDVSLTDCGDSKAHPYRAYGNAVFNNLTHATSFAYLNDPGTGKPTTTMNGSSAVNIAASAFNTGSNPKNVIGPNMMWTYNNAWPAMYDGTVVQTTGAGADTMTNTTGNLVAAPVYVNAGDAFNNGLQLSTHPSLAGKALTASQAALRDMLGNLPTTSPATYYFGAYFSH